MDVDLEHLRTEREGGFVLDVPALRLRGGRTTAILGPNGSGKTTMLRLIAGLERPREGGVRLGGSAIVPGRHVAYVFQEQVFLRGSVRSNLELGLRLRGVAPAARRERAEEAAAHLGISHLLDRRADHLSGGEGRRVSLARALCLRAPLVLLDEPLEGLDTRTYGRLLDELPALLAAFDATTLLVTHNGHEALRLAEDLVILVGGRVRASGSTREVATSVRHADVADVLGHAVLTSGDRRLAVPPGALRVGHGCPEFTLVVANVVDLVDRLEIVGRIGEARVHVVLPPAAARPAAGDRVVVHAERCSELT